MTEPLSHRLVRLSKVLLRFTTVQIAVQLLTMLVSLLLVRSMPKAQYAYYTIAMALLSTVLALSDSGMTSGLQAVGGPEHADDHRMGQLVRTGVALRRMMYFLAAAIVLPILPYMLWKAGARLPVVLETLVLVIIATQLQLVTGIYSAVPRLRGDVGVLQWMAFAGAMLRLLLILPAYFFHMSLGVALLSQILGGIGQVWILSRWSKKNLDMAASPDPGIRSAVWKIVRAQVPYEIYGVFQGQISVWLITLFGSTGQIADLGALTRLGVVFVIVPQVINSVLTPRLSRCTQPERLRLIYWQIFLAYVLFTGATLAAVLVRPDLILRLLGHQYTNNLHGDLVLVMILAAVCILQGGALAMNMSRGWIVPAYYGITLTIVTQIVAFSLVNLSTVRGVLLAGLAVALVNLILQLAGSEVFMRSTQRKGTQVASSVA
jgi:O-antigen/teichoic acid export membrane protein